MTRLSRLVAAASVAAGGQYLEVLAARETAPGRYQPPGWIFLAAWR